MGVVSLIINDHVMIMKMSSIFNSSHVILEYNYCEHAYIPNFHADDKYQLYFATIEAIATRVAIYT
jgi:hypothetical protein